MKHKILTPLINKSAERFLADKEKSTPMVHSTMHLQHLLHKSAQNPFSLADNSLEPIRKAVFEKVLWVFSNTKLIIVDFSFVKKS